METCKRPHNPPCHQEHGAGCLWWVALFLAVTTCADYQTKYESIVKVCPAPAATKAVNR